MRKTYGCQIKSNQTLWRRLCSLRNTAKQETSYIGFRSRVSLLHCFCTEAWLLSVFDSVFVHVFPISSKRKAALISTMTWCTSRHAIHSRIYSYFDMSASIQRSTSYNDRAQSICNARFFKSIALVLHEICCSCVVVRIDG